MKYYIYFIFIIILASCENANDIKGDISKLRSERKELYYQLDGLRYSINTLQDSIAIVSEQFKVLNIKQSGRTPVYVIRIRLKQDRVSLSISEHMKDSMNAIEFELPVNEEFYNSVQVNTKIVDEFRAG